MGRSYTSKYRVEYRLVLSVGSDGRQRGVSWTPASWIVSSRDQRKADGKPTAENLRRHVESIEQSTRPGGVNEHLGSTTIRSAKLVNQDTGETVATYLRDELQGLAGFRQEPLTAIRVRHTSADGTLLSDETVTF